MPESVEELRIAAAERPKSGELKQKLGEAYLRQGQYDLAIAVLSEALRLLDQKNSARMAKSEDCLGNAKMGKAEKTNSEILKKQAVKNMENAVKLDPDFISAHYNLMAAYKKTGRTDEAMTVFDLLQSTEPKDAEGWIALGKAYLEQSESSKALFAFKKAENYTNGRFTMYEEISNSLYSHKMYDEALIYLEKTRYCNPSDIYSYNMKGIIYRRKNQHEEAIKEYVYASKLDPDDPGIFFNLGVAYFMSGQKGKCIMPLVKAKELDPNLVEVDVYLKKIKDASEKDTKLI